MLLLQQNCAGSGCPKKICLDSHDTCRGVTLAFIGWSPDIAFNQADLCSVYLFYGVILFKLSMANQESSTNPACLTALYYTGVKF